VNNWYNFYYERMNDRYRDHIASRYWDFIDYIIENSRGAEKIHEAGCGAANISRIVSKFTNAKLVLTDKCPQMLNLAKQNMKETEGYETALVNLLNDTCPDSDVVYSHGVLEHFDDEQIRTIVENQLKSAKTVIHYVPSAKYSSPSFGDERLMTVDKWKEICNL